MMIWAGIGIGVLAVGALGAIHAYIESKSTKKFDIRKRLSISLQCSHCGNRGAIVTHYQEPSAP